TTEDDWNNVGLTLVSGRPISYRMDLYAPLYAQRPLEQLQLYASLRPQVYGQDMDKKEEQFRGAGQAARPKRESMARSDLAAKSGRLAAGAAAAPAPTAAPAGEPEGLQLGALHDSAGPSAQAGDVGELFQYTIGTPVTLARQKSAMLPIVNES